jgi:tRNA threonylcarbamoyladenosine biosynthesis protein TsaE
LVTSSFICETPEQTFKLGEVIGHQARPGEVWCLTGGLGAGKTLFVQGIAKGLGCKSNVTSPTFTLQQIYEGRLNLYHFDWYRLEQNREVDDLGWAEWLGKGGVVAVEWGDKFLKLFPAEVIKMAFEPFGPESRRLIVEAKHPESMDRVQEIIRCWPL